MLQFNLKGTSVPVKLDGVDYELREMSAASRDAHLDSLQGRIETGPDGKTQRVVKFQGMQTDLVARCLFKDGESKPVSAEMISDWPTNVVQGLYAEAQKINRLAGGKDTDKVVDEAKKS